MKDETQLVLSIMTGQEKYDDACKRIWKLREIQAPVLQCVIKEYQNQSISEVIGYINATTISDSVPVDDLPAFLEGSETEMSSITEKRVFYDIHFTAKNPKLSSENILVMLHIDFEVQNDYVPSNPKYPMTKRAVYYAARELSSQLNVITHNTNYAYLEKVYSIWICNEKVPDGLKNSITRYHIKKEDIMGECNENEAYHDLMEVIIIRRGGAAEEDTIFEYLEGVFTSNIKTVNKYVNVERNHEVKEALRTMCGLGESLENKAMEKGIQKGIQQGRFIQLIELVQSGDLSLERASQKAGMTVEDFEKKMKEICQIEDNGI